MNREPLLIWSSTLVALQVIVAGAALTDVIGASAAAFGALCVAAAQAGTSFYVRGQVTPSGQVVVQQRPGDATPVAGEAATVTTGQAVEVTLDPVPGPE